MKSWIGFVPSGWDLREEKPVRIPDFDEPEPDLAVVSGTRDDYADHHPGPGDIGLLVEVAESSLAWDRGAKLAAFARAGVSVYWIVNLIDRQVEVTLIPSQAATIATAAFTGRATRCRW